jgi:nucleotide-binding universal stress UspA family protein
VPTGNAPRVFVATHGHCFDGLCSAVMFTRLYRHRFAGDGATFAYHAAGYGPGQNGADPKLVTGDVNTILDFRYSPFEKLDWYFDHHVSAFVTPADRADYERRALAQDAAGERRFFHDGTYSSATKLIADIGRERFGLDAAPSAELVRWADMIDSAAFTSAKMAVDRAEPVLKLMTVVENLGDDAFLARMVPRLLSQPLAEVASAPDIVEAYEPLGRAHEAFVKLVEQRARTQGIVVVVDVSDQLIDVAGKFVTYALYPESAYSILLSRSKSKCKISIGYNPWSPVPRRHNIAAICERHGGGGHPVVGAISLPAGQVEEAKALVRSIADELAA